MQALDAYFPVMGIVILCGCGADGRSPGARAGACGPGTAGAGFKLAKICSARNVVSAQARENILQHAVAI